jgi:hypothetical protein
MANSPGLWQDLAVLLLAATRRALGLEEEPSPEPMLMVVAEMR